MYEVIIHYKTQFGINTQKEILKKLPMDMVVNTIYCHAIQFVIKEINLGDENETTNKSSARSTKNNKTRNKRR